jgi:Domain of unknown function (DUF4157)
VSDYGQRHRPPASGGPQGPRVEDPQYVGGGVQADLDWARNRVRNHFAANRDPANRISHHSYAALVPQPVQRKATNTGDWRRRLTGGPEAVSAKRSEAARGGRAEIPQSGGAPLLGDIRAKMEPQLGADLSGVKVHTGSESAEAAMQFGARAFTVGQDVHFGAGEYAPGTKEGDRLMAHELTHAVQAQKSGVQRKSVGINEDAGLEGEADAMGAQAAAGGREVSQPHEPAEQEADAVGDKVADSLHGGGGSHGKAGDGAKEAAPKIGAKLDGIGRKVFLAIDPNALAKKVTRPNDRHFIAKVDQKTLKKEKNSVTESSVNVAADIAAIRGGQAKAGNEDGVVTFTVNGRTYGSHDDGVLYPIRGTGIHELDRGAFQALGVLNELKSDPAKAEEILKKIKTTDAQKAAAMAAFKAG